MLAQWWQGGGAYCRFTGSATAADCCCGCCLPPRMYVTCAGRVGRGCLLIVSVLRLPIRLASAEIHVDAISAVFVAVLLLASIAVVAPLACQASVTS